MVLQVFTKHLTVIVKKRIILLLGQNTEGQVLPVAWKEPLFPPCGHSYLSTLMVDTLKVDYTDWLDLCRLQEFWPPDFQSCHFLAWESESQSDSPWYGSVLKRHISQSYDIPSEEFDLTKMSWGDHDILPATSHEYFNATSFWSCTPNSSWYKLVRSHLWVPCEFPVS